MKTIFTFLIVLVTYTHYAQDPYWNTAGNTDTNPLTDFLGTTDNADLRFRTFNNFRMTLTGDNGWLGLNFASTVAR